MNNCPLRSYMCIFALATTMSVGLSDPLRAEEAPTGPQRPRPVLDQPTSTELSQPIRPIRPANSPSTPPTRATRSTAGPESTTTTASATRVPAAAGPAAELGTTPAADTLDTIILVNQQLFRGTVLASKSTTATIAINTGSGILEISRDLVAVDGIVYGLTSRMGRVKDDDLNGLLDLAHWCRAKRFNTEALKILNTATALPGCDIVSRGLRAQLVDELEGADKALPLYVAYRNEGGTDPDILARYAELQKAHDAWEAQMVALGLDADASAASGKSVAATSSKVSRGYTQYKWTSDGPEWSSPAKPSTITLATPDGPCEVLQIDYEPHATKPNLDKAAVLLRRPIDLRPGTKLIMMVANRTAKDTRISIAVKTGKDWVYYESPAQVVKATSSAQEFTPMSFALSQGNFKSEGAGWSHTAKIQDLDQIRELQIQIHNGRSTGSIWIAGIDFEN
ncbi:MAG: hypothetical protein AAB263_06440 [Planctomycetota bacterium]